MWLRCDLRHHFDKAEPPAPQGDANAKVTIEHSGNVRLTGKLGDGSAWTISARITDKGVLPLYTPLYRSGGSISGPELRGAGQLFWSKPDEFAALLQAEATSPKPLSKGISKD